MNTKYFNAYRSLVEVDALSPLHMFSIENYYGLPYLFIDPLHLHHYEQYDNRDWVPEDVEYKPYGGFRLAEIRDDIGRMRFPCWVYGGDYYIDKYGDEVLTLGIEMDSLTYRH